MHKLSYFRAIVIGLFQGVTELFPVSSLGHSVLIAALLGWTDLVKAQSKSESFFLAFLVALHVGTALVLFVYFWRDWFEIIGDLVRSVRGNGAWFRPPRGIGPAVDRGDDPGRHSSACCSRHAAADLFAKPFVAAVVPDGERARSSSGAIESAPATCACARPRPIPRPRTRSPAASSSH